MNSQLSKIMIHAAIPFVALAALLAAGCSSQSTEQQAQHDHDHDSVDHRDSSGADDSHEGEKSEGGPHGGRLITEVDPAVEFIVEDDRFARILFLDADRRIVAPTTQVVSLIGGNRSAPTTLTFERSGDGLRSDKPLPQGNSVPVVLQIKPSPSTDLVREKFNVNLSECPTCSYLEYACVCGHDSDH